MFDKENGTVRILMYESIMHYPPTISLVQCLLQNGYRVHLTAQQTGELDKKITEHELFSCTEIRKPAAKSPAGRLAGRLAVNHLLRSELHRTGDADLVWTVNPLVVRSLGTDLLRFGDRHIMQVLELKSDLPLFKGSRFLRFDLAKYGRNAKKVVVAERNRAYIQRIEWNLDKLPYVIPNKPYCNEDAEITEDVAQVLRKMEQEQRKIIIYLGVLDPDREFAAFARAIETVSEEYCFYVFGKYEATGKNDFQELCKKYLCVNYMGFFNPPKHLAFLRHAYIALTPYRPGVVGRGFERLNALYCAPNKIYEYAGCNVPMIGTDVLGLIEPFEKYNIGICCKDLEIDTIVQAIRYVDEHRSEMTENCQAFCDAVDLDELIISIVN